LASHRSTLAGIKACLVTAMALGALACLVPKQQLSDVERAVQSILVNEAGQGTEAARVAFRATALQRLLVNFPQERFLYSDAMAALSIAALVADDFERPEFHRKGKEIGRQCLRLNGAWVVMEDLAGGRITAQALRRLDVSDLACARGLLVHWVRWVESQGMSGRVDIRPMGLLAERVNELAKTSMIWRDHWVLGMLAGLGSPSEENRNRAEFHFQKAMELAPGLATPAIDRLAAQIHQDVFSEVTKEGLRLLGKGDYAVHPSSPWAVQNQHALKRAIELLAQLREIKNE
jgi:hypothetical protein